MATRSADTLARPPRVLARSKATRFSNSHRSAGRWTPVVLYGRSSGSDAAVFFAMPHSVPPVNCRLATVTRGRKGVFRVQLCWLACRYRLADGDTAVPSVTGRCSARRLAIPGEGTSDG